MKKQEAIVFKEDEKEIRVHILKTWLEFFNALIEVDIEKRKHLELRYNDRDYKVGDYLYLQEYNLDTKEYTGRVTWKYITHIVKNIPHLTNGYIAMSIIDKLPMIKLQEEEEECFRTQS